jgi:glycosyltransferase involved in cell wall biosynthesis
VVPLAELQRRSGNLGLSAWFSTALDGFVPFHVRSRHATKPFPITLVHHTVSYQRMLHDTFLPLLLAETMPCDSIICPSAASRRAVEVLLDEVAHRFNERHGTRLRFGGRLDTIPIGVDTEALRPTEQAQSRRSLSLPEEPLIILWLGRLSVADKADLVPLLRAFSDVKHYARELGGDAARPLMLVIAGADPYGESGIFEHQARALGVADAVRIYTQVDAFSKAAFYSAADIFVAPVDNVQETFGLAPVEAMACGVPQVVADWDGYRDTVAHEQTGLCVPTVWLEADADVLDDAFMWEDIPAHGALAQSVAVDPTALRMALVKLVLNEDLRRRMASASRQRAEAMFSWPRVIAQLEALWAELYETAAGLPALRPAAAPDHFQPFFFRAFSHYATRILDDSHQIRLSPTGSAARGDHGELAPAVVGMDPGLLRRVLEHLGDEPVAIGDLMSALDRELDGSYPDSLLRREVMRLLKYGYARPA